MYAFTLESEAMSRIPIEGRYELIMHMLEGLIGINEIYLSSYPDTPQLYESGVVYTDQVPEADPFSTGMQTDRWQDIPRLLMTGAGACEDLASWRVAELRAQGDLGADVTVLTQPDGQGNVLYHIRVIKGDGTLEDPSAVLGMPTHGPDIY